MKPAAPLLPLLLAAAGCAAAAGVADPPLAQLARWRNAAREAIAAEPVVAPCPADNPACPRLHALRAEACLAQALADRAPGAACPPSSAAPLLDCAAEHHRAALAARPPAGASGEHGAAAGARARAAGNAGAPARAPADPGTGTSVLRAGLAQALLCRAELDATAAAAATRAAAAAEAAEGAPPELAALHGARAALLLARVGPATGRCDAARRALVSAAAAPPAQQGRLRADALLHLRTCEAPRP